MARKFIYDKREFPDPDPSLTVEQVKLHMANFFPELAQADIKDLGERKVEPSPAEQLMDALEGALEANVSGKEVVPPEPDHLWEFERKVGTKGDLRVLRNGVAVWTRK